MNCDISVKNKRIYKGEKIADITAKRQKILKQ